VFCGLPCVVGNVAENARAPPIPPSEHLDDGFRASNSVEVEPQAMNAEEAHDMDDDETYYMNEEEPYDIARASDSRVIYVHAIKKVAGYAHAMEKFSDTCMPCTQNSLTCMPFRPTSEVTVSTRHVK
jgi:hypothetical protein